MRDRGTIIAHPNPIPIDDYSDAGVTTLTWETSDAEILEVHVNSPDGPLLSRTGPAGRTTTGKWVTNGMSFYLQDASRGKALTLSSTVDAVTVYVSRSSFAPPLSERLHAIENGPAVGSYRSRVLVAGWFSFENCGATAGDLLALDVACEWLASAGCSYDVAVADPFRRGVDWRVVEPDCYSHVVFVCGPFGQGRPSLKLLERFPGCRIVGLNLSMIEPVHNWNPFDFLLERDSAEACRPDICFASRASKVPVIGLILVESTPTPEYKERAMHDAANDTIRRLLATREMSIVEIDTRLQGNATGLRSASEVESLIARMDAVVTTRLHGMVLAIKNSVPAIAVDPYAGGDKIFRQASTIGWPLAFTADSVDEERLRKALEYALTDEGRKNAELCARRVTRSIERIREDFTAEFRR